METLTRKQLNSSPPSKRISAISSSCWKKPTSPRKESVLSSLPQRSSTSWKSPSQPKRTSTSKDCHSTNWKLCWTKMLRTSSSTSILTLSQDQEYCRELFRLPLPIQPRLTRLSSTTCPTTPCQDFGLVFSFSLCSESASAASWTWRPTIALPGRTCGLVVSHDRYLDLYSRYISCFQKSKVEGSGLGTFRLFLKRNSAKVSTGSLGNECSNSTMPSESIGTRFTSRYFLKANDFLSKISRYSFCSFSFFMM